MADTLWVRVKVGFHGHHVHALRFDNPSATVCGAEVGDDDEVIDQINVTDDVCNNCLRVIGMKGDVEEVLEITLPPPDMALMDTLTEGADPDRPVVLEQA